jgi:ATP-dependent Clp protease ATP-binding subunit ClpA
MQHLGPNEMMGHTETGIMTGRVASSQSLIDRYSEATRRAISFAQEETDRRGGSEIGIADLLAGLSVDEDTRAARVGALKANAFYLRWLSGLTALPAKEDLSHSAGNTTQPSFDLEARRALAFAVMEADRDREYWIDSDHLLRGMMRFPNKAHFAILKTEINLNTLRLASRRDREAFLPEENPNMKVVQYLLRKHLALWLPPVLSLACYLYILIQGFGLELSALAK